MRSHGWDTLDKYAIPIKAMYRKVYETALEQKYNWALAYTEKDIDDPVAPYNVSIFILQQIGSNLRYAVQNPAKTRLWYPADPYYNYTLSGNAYEDGIVEIVESETIALNVDYDCRFPVPWLIYTYPRDNDLGDGPIFDFNYNNVSPYSDSGITNQFQIPGEYADLLVPGSVIMDADPEMGVSRPILNQVGGLYRVEAVSPVQIDSTTSKSICTITLNRSIKNNDDNCLFAFWVFPPAIDRDSAGNITWHEEQPVLDVKQSTLWFNKK